MHDSWPKCEERGRAKVNATYTMMLEMTQRKGCSSELLDKSEIEPKGEQLFSTHILLGLDKYKVALERWQRDCLK